MKTKITELFDIKYPIILPGMSWISVPELVAAVSNAGGLGILATGPLSPEKTRESIKKIRELTSKPFGAGASLLLPGAMENAKVLLEEKVPVVNFSLGKGDWIVKKAHAYGGKVIATVVNHRHALAAQRYGVDALLVTGHEAAAHGGLVTSLVLIPAIVDAVKIPVIGTGGFGDGRGLIAALSLGAEGIALGTRFSVTKESPVHSNSKNATIEKGIEDTIYSDRFDGLNCRLMKTQSAYKATRRGMSLPRAIVSSMGIAKQLNQSWFKLVFGAMIKGPTALKKDIHMASAFRAIIKATNNGDLYQGVHLIGQVQGLVQDIPTVAELVKRIVAEAETVQRKNAAVFEK